MNVQPSVKLRNGSVMLLPGRSELGFLVAFVKSIRSFSLPLRTSSEERSRLLLSDTGEEVERLLLSGEEMKVLPSLSSVMLLPCLWISRSERHSRRLRQGREELFHVYSKLDLKNYLLSH